MAQFNRSTGVMTMPKAELDAFLFLECLVQAELITDDALNEILRLRVIELD